ncbi:class I SAM-dependent methyltransferase [Bradyrhizobium lablabi]|uniref:class I SAM-dependent methyltransferase n=1 Tax=Bradyrhizobium lablabi TaxID=722472 RepID=UPI001BA52A9A|nr:class I SAM-dependent methyltransferase [Bradyrhizobium lablabi]MBR0697775.1 class I SAM-dependent methyltransferase [Bradyrhizobium lablabi]
MTNKSLSDLRPAFEEIYRTHVIGAGFFESDDYYRRDKERYWRSLEILSSQDLPRPARILEIGGGQLAILRKLLFNDSCVVGDISEKYVAPLKRANVEFLHYNLLEQTEPEAGELFDVIILLEVIEHIPKPAYTIFANLKKLLRKDGILFVTTPNLFRLRNLIRMFLGIEFLDRFMLPQPEQGLGHQLEYSAEHLQWQFEQAGMRVVLLQHDELGRVGHSPKARLARTLLAPLRLRPMWRDGLVAIGRCHEE